MHQGSAFLRVVMYVFVVLGSIITVFSTVWTITAIGLLIAVIGVGSGVLQIVILRRSLRASARRSFFRKITFYVTLLSLLIAVGGFLYRIAIHSPKALDSLFFIAVGFGLVLWEESITIREIRRDSQD